MKKLAVVALLFCVPAVAQSAGKPKSNEKTVEGCLLREGPDFLLRPVAGGALIHLSANSSDDLAAHLGQRLRVHGSEQAAGKNAPNTAANQPVTPVEKQPAPSTLPSGTPDPSVPVTQLPQSAQAGEGTEGFRGTAPAPELYVSSFEPVAGSCKPAAARKRR